MPIKDLGLSIDEPVSGDEQRRDLGVGRKSRVGRFAQ